MRKQKKLVFALLFLLSVIELSVAQSFDSITYVLTYDKHNFCLIGSEDSISVQTDDSNGESLATIFIDSDTILMSIGMPGVYDLEYKTGSDRTKIMYLEYPFSELMIVKIGHRGSRQIEIRNSFVVKINDHEVKNQHQLSDLDWSNSEVIKSEPITSIFVSSIDGEMNLKIEKSQTEKGSISYSFVAREGDRGIRRCLVAACTMVLWIYRENH
ncbi:MAG: hypothetical protein ACK5DD_14920 [Cyclobacteriaceae bacterium]|jgi:hypothetical protein